MRRHTLITYGLPASAAVDKAGRFTLAYGRMPRQVRLKGRIIMPNMARGRRRCLRYLFYAVSRLPGIQGAGVRRRVTLASLRRDGRDFDMPMTISLFVMADKISRGVVDLASPRLHLRASPSIYRYDKCASFLVCLRAWFT